MNKVLIGPFQQGALHAFNSIANLPLILKVLQDQLNTDKLFYTYMFQAGADEFVVASTKWGASRESSFISKRISFLPEKAYENTSKIINPLFDSLSTKENSQTQKLPELGYFEALLCDLFLALQNRLNLVCVLPIPKPSSVKGYLSPELYYSLENLMHMFRPIEINLPFLKISTIESKDVRVFQEIVESDLFAEFSLTQKELSDAKQPADRIILRVAKSGKELVHKFKRWLHNKPFIVHCLHLTPRIIDQISGSTIPANSIVENVIKPGIECFEENKRIVLYDFSSALDDIIIDRFQLFFDKTGTGYKLNRKK